MATGNTQEMKALRKQLMAQGFDVYVVKNGHWQVVAPDGRKCQIAHSPSDYRAIKNIRSRLKKALGFVPPKR